MSDSQARQIKQMVAFILQEADERCSELRIRTEHDFELAKQNLVHAGKVKVQEEFAQREKDLSIMERVQRSTAVSTARVSKMQTRDALLVDLKADALKALGERCRGTEYPKLLEALIVQGLIKVEEQTVEVQCREEDVQKVKSVLANAVATYVQLMKQAGHGAVNPHVTLSANRLAPGSTLGGVVLIARNNRIVVNQTVEARLDIAYTAVQPKVRAALFPTRI